MSEQKPSGSKMPPHGGETSKFKPDLLFMEGGSEEEKLAITLAREQGLILCSMLVNETGDKATRSVIAHMEALLQEVAISAASLGYANIAISRAKGFMELLVIRNHNHTKDAEAAREAAALKDAAPPAEP